MAKVLVVGGAGYVGGAACAWLMDQEHEVWVLDDLSTGHAQIVRRLKGVAGFVQSRAGNASVVGPFLAHERFDCVMHFAASSLVSESVTHSAEYHENNVLQTRALLDSMLAAGTRRFVFSSSCSIFGDPGPGISQIHEGLPKKPIHPYGANKLEVEQMLEALASSHGLQAIALRYFNAAGAEPGGRVGEWHEPETHLIPRVLKAALAGSPVEIYGTDYPTPDGTAIRDYVDVWDLVSAHGAAMRRLMSMESGAGCFEAYNLGSEKGYSVREMISACERTIGRKIATVERPRRVGDPARLVSDSSLAREVLGFQPGKYALERIFESAWNWELELETFTGPGKAVFLDRDGTINVDPGYLSDPKQMELIAGVGEALAGLKRAGFSLVVVSNQSGVGRGMISPDALPKIHARMEDLLSAWGVQIDRYELCIHRPEDKCACRKPKTKLLKDGARTLSVDLSRSYMVGDKLSDLEAGRGSLCKGVALVRTGYGSETEKTLRPGDTDFIGDSLPEVARWILAQENASP